MSQELFYTSAPRGLKPGSGGFCTVAATRGMSAALLEKLESLSGYRPLYPPLDPKAALNPVAYSHLRLSVAGKTYHVLSRIGPAGLDYTERSNKFAHHVVLEPGELPEAGPAWLLQQPGFMETAWEGEVKVLEAGRPVPQGTGAPGVCRAWEALTGDAGWAGVLAEAFQQDPNRPAYLVFEPGMEVLPLFAEALALMPVAQRWEVTFTTYFVTLPRDALCWWRCVLRDSPEARKIDPAKALILQLGHMTGMAPRGAGAFSETKNAGNHTGPADVSPAAPCKPVKHANALTSGPSVPPPPPSLPSGRKRQRSPVGLLLVGMVVGVVAGIGVSSVPPGSHLLFWTKSSDARKGNEPDEKRVALGAPAQRGDPGSKKGDQAESPGADKEIDQVRKTNEELVKELNERDARIDEVNTSLDEAGRTNADQRKQIEESKKRIEELEAQLAGLKKPQAAEAKPVHQEPEFVANYLRLPSSGNPQGELLLKEISVDSGRCDLSLRGLRTDVKGKYKLVTTKRPAELVVRLEKGMQGGLLARFWLMGSKLHFEWKAEGIVRDLKPDEISEARRNLRNAVLEVKGPDPGSKAIMVGLMRDLVPTNPIIWNLARNPRPNHPVAWEKREYKPLGDLHLAFVECAIQSRPAQVVADGDQLNLRWQEKILIQLEKDHDAATLIAEWKGSPEAAPTLTITSFAVYMKVDGLNVEVLRYGKVK